MLTFKLGEGGEIHSQCSQPTGEFAGRLQPGLGAEVCAWPKMPGPARPLI